MHREFIDVNDFGLKTWQKLLLLPRKKKIFPRTSITSFAWEMGEKFTADFFN